MKTHIKTVIIVLLLAYSLPALAQTGPPWIKYNVGYNYIFRGIDFPSAQGNIGFMAGESLTYNGNGIVIKTTDGGTTWNPVWNGTNMGCEGSCFVDVNNGFIAGWPKPANGWSGFGKTTDGGLTWSSPAVTPDIYYFTDVVFKDPNNGILLGATNTGAGVWVTSNGGTTWSNAGGLSGIPYHGCHVSGNTYFLADNAGHIQKSTDNGFTWSTVFSQNGLLFTGIRFLDDNTGMAVGDNGVMVKTSDGGSTWSLQTVGTDIWHDTGWETPEHVYVCGTPEIVAESFNGGGSWGNGFPGSSLQAALYECIFTSSGWGFICGSQGTLLKRVPSCTAAFSAAGTNLCSGGSTTFTSQSTGTNLTFLWTFPGGTPSSSTLPNPQITYSLPGVYDVKLKVSNGYWSDSLTRSGYMHVNNLPAAPVILANGYILSSNYPQENQWYRDGNPIAGANSQQYEATQSGTYWDKVTLDGCESDTSNHLFLVMTGLGSPRTQHLQLSPIPSTGTFTLSFFSFREENCRVTLTDNLGKNVYGEDFKSAAGRNNKTLVLPQLPGGLYFVTLNSDAGPVSRKMIITLK